MRIWLFRQILDWNYPLTSTSHLNYGNDREKYLGWWPAIIIWSLQLSDWIQKRPLCAFMIQQSLCFDPLKFSHCPDSSWPKHTQLCQQKKTSSFSISLKIRLKQVSRIFSRFTFRKAQSILRTFPLRSVKGKLLSCRNVSETQSYVITQSKF